MRKYLLIAGFCLLVSGLMAQNGTTTYHPLNSQTDLENRTIESVLAATSGDAAVGKTPSSWAVSPSGAFTYSVPIQLPKGTKGMVPNLSVEYNSQSGNGTVGYGWNLGGLSSISRTNNTIYDNGGIKAVKMELEDQLMLDGNRLIALTGANGVNGTIYGTQNQTYSKITARGTLGNGPEWFEVELKNGVIMEYGKTADSRDLATGANSIQSVISWRLNKTIDRNGNYMEYQYIWLNGEQLIGTIKYTGNALEGVLPYNEVSFEYSERTDTEYRVITEQGKNASLENLLDKITIDYDGSHYKTYTFQYGYDQYSYLKGITESGANHSGEAFIPLEFSYAFSGHHFTEHNTGTNHGDFEHRIGDFNGDGLSDILRITTTLPNNQKNYVSYDILLNNNGTFTGYNYSFPNGRILQQSYNQDLPKYDGLGHFMLGDFNGDGKTDISYSHVNETNAEDDLYLADLIIQFSNCTQTTVGFTSQNYGLPDPFVYKYLGRRNVFIQGDFNGDGAEDLHLSLHNGTKEDYGVDKGNGYYSYLLYPAVSSGYELVGTQFISNQFEGEIQKMCIEDVVHVVDMNGDGKAEILQMYGHIADHTTSSRQFDETNDHHHEYVYFDSHGTNAYANWPNKNLILRFGDFNGDGKTDILATEQNDKVTWDIKISEGSGFQNYGWLTMSTVNYGEHVQIADFDGDGKSDILHSIDLGTTTDLHLKYTRSVDGGSQTITFDQQTENFSARITGARAAYLLDFDGDGAVDIMDATSVSTPFQVADLNYNTKYGTLTGVSTGFCEYMNIGHESIAKEQDVCRSIYTKGAGAAFPLLDLHKPLFVTTSVEAPDQSGLNGKLDHRIENRYFYEGAKVHLEGRGFLGFDRIGVEQRYLSGNEAVPVIYSETEYEFDLQFYFSRIKQQFSSITNDNSCKADRTILKNLSSSENTCTVDDFSNGQFSNKIVSTISGDNLNGQTKRVDYTYGPAAVGNIIRTVETVGGSGQGQTVTTTDFEFGQYGSHIPEKVTYKEVSTVRNSEAPAVFRQQYDYDGKGNLIEEISLDDASNHLVETAYEYESNQFGLVSKIRRTVQGHANPIREENFGYDSKGRHLVWKTDAIDNSESWTYDPSNGRVKTYNDIIQGNPLESYNYDVFHRKAGMTDTDGNTTTIDRAYDPNSGTAAHEPTRKLYSITTTSSLVGTDRVWYDHLGNVRETESEGFVQKTHTVNNYSSRGLLKERYEPFYGGDVNNKQSWQYDEFGRTILTEVMDLNGVLLTRISATPPAHTGVVAAYTYTNTNNVQTTADLAGKSQTITTDATGVMIQSEDDGGTLSYEYNSFGQPTKVLLGNEPVSIMKYDANGYQTELDEVNSGKTQYEYNILGELIRQEDANGNLTDGMVYDKAGRLTEKTVNGSEVFQYEYYASGNGRGQLWKESSLNNGIHNVYSYNSNGKLIQLEEDIQGVVFTTKYAYSNGRLSSEEYHQTGQAQPTVLGYHYTPTGYLSKISNANNIGVGTDFYRCFAKNAKGQTTSYERINGDQMTKSYSTASLPEVVSSNYYYKSYNFNSSNGNLNSRQGLLPHQLETFGYDVLERLKTVNLSGTSVLAMEYELNGNMTMKSDVGNYLYHPSKPNALTEVSNPNAAIANSTQIIEYDAQHNPSKIIEGAIEWTFEYGPNHQRKKATIRNTETDEVRHRYYTVNAEYEYKADYQVSYQVDYITAEGELCGAVVYGAAKNVSKAYAIYTDHLGSIELVTNDKGKITAELSYDAWGRYRDPNTWATSSGFTPNKPEWLWRGYTGHEHLEEFQLINMNGRLYDPMVGRMLSPDNFVQDNTATQNFNRYSYVMNNPLKYTDPSGEFLITFTAIVIGSAVIGGGLNLWANSDNVNSFGDGAYYFGVGAAVGAGTAVGGAVLAPVIGTGGIAGAVFGVTGGFITQFANTAYATGGNWNAALDAGLVGALWGGLGGVIIAGGIAGFSGNNFWTGAKPTPGSSLFSFKDIAGREGSPSWNFRDAHSVRERDFWKLGRNLKSSVEVDAGQMNINENIHGIDNIKQDPHLINHPRYDPSANKSFLSESPSALLKDIHSGNYTFSHYNSRGMPVLQFDRTIGTVIGRDGAVLGPTMHGTIHIKKNGLIHIVPFLK